MNELTSTATLGGGCFWCLEAAFERLRGVSKVESGYAGGESPDPTYREVCSGSTGHAEVVRVDFDPAQISYRDLLEVFFTVHDPTTRNRQGGDVGTQYRSVIFTESDEQHAVARAVIAELEGEGIWTSAVVTEVTPLPTFYPAELDHQSYYENNQMQPYCQAVIEPKLRKLRARHLDKLRQPATESASS